MSILFFLWSILLCIVQTCAFVTCLIKRVHIESTCYTIYNSRLLARTYVHSDAQTTPDGAWTNLMYSSIEGMSSDDFAAVEWTYIWSSYIMYEAKAHSLRPVWRHPQHTVGKTLILRQTLRDATGQGRRSLWDGRHVPPNIYEGGTSTVMSSPNILEVMSFSLGLFYPVTAKTVVCCILMQILCIVSPKSLSFWGTSSSRSPTGALPLDPAGGLPSPRSSLL